MTTNLVAQKLSVELSEAALSETPALQNLIAKLSDLEQVPTLETLRSFFHEAHFSHDDLLPHLGFRAGNYTRHLVYRNKYAEMLVLCWRPGQKTPIHDHNGSHGLVFVCQGIMWETMFHLDETESLRYQSVAEWRQDQMTGAEVPDIHQIGNPEVTGQDLITIHIYAPPLGVLNTYKVGTSEIGSYTPSDFIDGAGI